jgi:hypothetical protein
MSAPLLEGISVKFDIHNFYEVLLSNSKFGESRTNVLGILRVKRKGLLLWPAKRIRRKYFCAEKDIFVLLTVTCSSELQTESTVAFRVRLCVSA